MIPCGCPFSRAGKSPRGSCSEDLKKGRNRTGTPSSVTLASRVPGALIPRIWVFPERALQSHSGLSIQRLFIWENPSDSEKSWRSCYVPCPALAAPH